MSNPLQFRLRNLFAITAAIALLLGLWRLLDGRSGLALVLGAEAAIPVVWRPRWLYSWFLPLFWTTVAWNNFYYPGDEYGGFFLGGALPGLWIIAIVGSMGNVQHTAVLVVAAGAVTVAVAGWLLDKLRAPFVPWALLSLVSAAGLFAWSLSHFPTIERALAKNGSYEAYVLPALNVGLTFATLVM
ncbi:MAG: hypothetical protein ACREHD_28655, partial [Pirellulales bacterium]